MPRAALDAISAAAAVWQRHNKAPEGCTPEKERQFIAPTAAWEKTPKTTRGARPKVVYTPTYRNVPCPRRFQRLCRAASASART